MLSKTMLAAAVAALSVTVSAAAPADRYSVEPSDHGIPQCRFHSVPNLLLASSRKDGVVIAKFEVPAKEANGKATRLNVDIAPDNPDWHGVGAWQIWFTIIDDRFHENEIDTAEITLDGQRLDLNPYAKQDEYAGSLAYDVAVKPQLYTPSLPWFNAIERGSVVSVTVFDHSHRAYGPWTFDVSAMRRIPDALKAARWSCK